MGLKVGTFSVVIGGTKCNARCPYCVSHMTPSVCSRRVEDNPKKINKQRLEDACRVAVAGGVTTALLTGKGEPTLYPRLLKDHVKILKKYFPIIELQTNGVAFKDNLRLLNKLGKLGVTTIALSVSHIEDIRNSKNLRFQKLLRYWPLVDSIHKAGMSVRLSIIMAKDDPEDVLCADEFRFTGTYKVEQLQRFIGFCKEHKVEQLTARLVERPNDPSRDGTEVKWVDSHRPSDEDMKKIQDWVVTNGIKLLELPHGATVYDIDGQSVCISTCLTESSDPNDIRQLIYYPDGHLRFSWQYEGAILF